MVRDTIDGDNRQIVLEVSVKDRSFVGLGLYHVYYGSSQRRIGLAKLTIRLPDHVLLREEFADGTVIEYGSNYLKVGNGLAPHTIRHVSELPDLGSWILVAEFQVVDRCWLLKEAENRHKDVLVKSMKAEDVSTKSIDADKITFPEAN